MYSRSIPYDSNIGIQSDLERSRRFGSGVYPDYSRVDQVHKNITNASASPAQRNMHQTKQESTPSRDSVVANLRTIEGGQNNTAAELPSSSVSVQPSVPNNLDLRNMFSNLNMRDPFQAFILEPRTSEIEDAMYNAIACKYLPPSVKEKRLNWQSEQSRNLLGIMSQDILPEDSARFKRCIAVLDKLQYDSEKEPALGKDMNFLLQKYGKTALYRQVEAYTECCRKVWHYYNPGHTTNPPDHEIFDPYAEACYNIIFTQINELLSNNKIWAGIVCNGLYLKDTCGALALTLKIDPNIKIPAKSIKETFESVYLNDAGHLTNASILNDLVIDSADDVNSQSIWERIASALCCGA